jgi:ferredoxin-NADP reductase
MVVSQQQRLAWQEATVVGREAESDSATSLYFDVPNWSGHLPGQHVDLRLTAEDGYQATRSYSVSSGPSEAPQITVERVDDGEVSPFLADVAEIGDTLELRGPVGGYFIWDKQARPDQQLFLIGGGSGIAPLRAMWRAADGVVPTTVLYSTQTRERIIFRTELEAASHLKLQLHLTREDIDGFEHGHITADTIVAALADVADPAVFVCGPTSFVEAMATHLVDLEVEPRNIRTERFG